MVVWLDGTKGYKGNREGKKGDFRDCWRFVRN